MAILLIGAGGFLGANLFKALGESGEVVGTVRPKNGFVGCRNLVEVDVTPETDWVELLKDIECIVFCIGLAHVVNNGKYIEEQFYNVNCLNALNLAQQAATCGVKRFLYISSIGVNGVSTKKPFMYTDLPNPQDPYSGSKSEAESGLKKIAKETGIELTIIRPPLIYGVNAPGNFGKLFSLVKKNLPLPLGAINNKRSFVSIDNLVDLVRTCIYHPYAANQTFLVSDDHDVSTSELLRLMIIAAGRKPRLIPVPIAILRFLASVLGKGTVIDKISSNLQVDISHTKDTLGWIPPVPFEDGIHRCFK